MQSARMKHALLYPKTHAAIKSYATDVEMTLTETIEAACQLLLKKPKEETIAARRAGIEPFSNPFIRQQIMRAQKTTVRLAETAGVSE